MENKRISERNLFKISVLILILIGITSSFAFSLASVLATESINLDGKTGEVKVSDSNSLEGFNEATWNMWVNQKNYVNNAGIIGKYAARTGQRSYLIRTSYTNGTSIVLSQDGVNVGTYGSALSKGCGVRTNDQWSMITVTYNGSLITYYRNGVKCDQDQTSITALFPSPSPVRLGGGNNIFFSGGIDEFTIYNKSLNPEQITRIYNESNYGTNLGESIPVLVYHKVEDGINETIKVSTTQFRQQMEYLKKNGFNAITLRDYDGWRAGNFNMPEKAIILVFDDGFSSVYTNAKPIMDEQGFVGSIATVTRYASFTSNTSGYMNWVQTKSLSDKGWDIESHGLTHSHLLTLNESQFRNELLSSREIITNKTGKTPTSFVFPFHESNDRYASICGEYYSLCWTQGSLNPTYDFKSTSGTRYLSLRRINVVDITSSKDFADFLRMDTDKAGEWYMEEGSGTNTADTSGNNNLGFLMNGASWAVVSMSSRSISNMLATDTLSSTELDKQLDVNDMKDNIKDSDKGKPDMKIDKKQKWPDNMPIEEDRFYADAKAQIEKEDKKIKEDKEKNKTKSL